MDCIRTQTEARSNLNRKPDDLIARHCRNEWGTDFEMVEFCDNNQRSAKRVIERSYGSDPARRRCEGEWGIDYETILYCLRN